MRVFAVSSVIPTQQIKTTVSVYRQGQQLEISSEELVVGDTVSLSAGERVPADLRLIQIVWPLLLKFHWIAFPI